MAEVREEGDRIIVDFGPPRQARWRPEDQALKVIDAARLARMVKVYLYPERKDLRNSSETLGRLEHKLGVMDVDVIRRFGERRISFARLGEEIQHTFEFIPSPRVQVVFSRIEKN